MQQGRARKLILIKQFILAFIGLSSGLMVAGGVFAFITVIGVIQRLASRTQTASRIRLYENIIIFGGCFGNLIFLYKISIPFGVIGLILYGLFSGIFTGCFAMALAEMLKVFPVFVRRINITKGIPYIVLAVALGKGIGAFIQLYFW